MAILNLGSKTTHVALRANSLGNATATGSAVDLNAYEGDMIVFLDASAGGGTITYAVKLTECDTSGGTYTDVSSGAFETTGQNAASAQKITLNTNDLKRYVKCVVTVANGTGTGYVSVNAFASEKYGA
jgi:phosphoenolpyruvate-protein kinase (PTS system EI component)